jgi:Uma2 family endonuclease
MEVFRRYSFEPTESAPLPDRSLQWLNTTFRDSAGVTLRLHATYTQVMALGLPSGALLTYEDLRDVPDDGRRYELLDGALLVTPAPGGRHQVVVGALYRMLWAARPAGTTVLVSPIDFVPRPETVLQPDVVIVNQGEADQPRLTRAPLLVVEVISPSSRTLDLGAKRYAYAEAGVAHYWVVDPESPIELVAFELVGSAYEQVAKATGASPYEATRPFVIRVVPESLREL